MTKPRVAVGVGLLALLVWMLLPSAESASPPVLAAEEEAPRRSHARAGRSSRRRAPRPAAPPVTRVRERDFIDLVRVEPPVACVGEDIVVTTELRRGMHGLRVSTAGQAGRRAVVRFDEPGVHELRSVANAWEPTVDVETAAVEVEECETQPSIEIRVERLPLDRIRFHAERSVGLGEGLEYRWSFGDGEHAQGRRSTVEHDYAFRRVDGPDSSFLVRLEVTDAAGRRAERLANVHFVNAAYLSAWLGQPILPARATALHPEERADGFVSHLEVAGLELLGDTELTSVEVTAFPCRGEGREAVSLDIDEVLSSTHIAAGERTSLDLFVPRASLPDGTCDLEVRLGGSSSGLFTEAIVPLRVGVDPEDGRRLEGAEADRVRAALQQAGRRSATYAELGLIPGASDPP